MYSINASNPSRLGSTDGENHPSAQPCPQDTSYFQRIYRIVSYALYFITTPFRLVIYSLYTEREVTEIHSPSDQSLLDDALEVFSTLYKNVSVEKPAQIIFDNCLKEQVQHIFPESEVTLPYTFKKDCLDRRAKTCLGEEKTPIPSDSFENLYQTLSRFLHLEKIENQKWVEPALVLLSQTGSSDFFYGLSGVRISDTKGGVLYLHSDKIQSRNPILYVDLNENNEIISLRCEDTLELVPTKVDREADFPKKKDSPPHFVDFQYTFSGTMKVTYDKASQKFIAESFVGKTVITEINSYEYAKETLQPILKKEEDFLGNDAIVDAYRKHSETFVALNTLFLHWNENPNAVDEFTQEQVCDLISLYAQIIPDKDILTTDLPKVVEDGLFFLLAPSVGRVVDIEQGL